MIPVIALDIDGALNVETSLMQQVDGSVTLRPRSPRFTNSGGLKLNTRQPGVVEGWVHSEDSIDWSFQLRRSGRRPHPRPYFCPDVVGRWTS